MNRNSLMEMSGRVMHGAMRFTLNKGMDQLMMQELHLDGMNSDGRDKVERVQNYGFSSTPLPRDEQQGGGEQGGGGQIGDAVGKILGEAAEGICMFIGGQRNHPVCIGVDDRRHRPMGLMPGENAQYDDIGQMTLLRRAFTAILSLDSKDAKTGKTVERFVSLRHVNKPKQPRPKSSGDKPKSSGDDGGTVDTRVADGGSGGGSGGGAQSKTKQTQDFKHEGESVNTEVRSTAKTIEFRSGDKIVGVYDKGSDTWTINESGGNFKLIISPSQVIGQYKDAKKSFRVDKDHTHIRYEDNAIWVNKDGCFSSKAITLAPDTCS